MTARRGFVIGLAGTTAWLIPVGWKVVTSPVARHFLFHRQP